jgi:hypothetical protein
MALNNGVNSIIHLAADIDTTNYVYYQVYAGADVAATINGVSVAMIGGTVLDIKVSTLAGANVYALGSPKSMETASPTLSNYPNP